MRRRLFAKSKRETCREFWPRQRISAEVRECAPANVRANTHRAPQMGGLDAAPVVDREERAVVRHDDFAAGIQRNVAGCRIRRIDLPAKQRRRTMPHERRESTDSGHDVRSDARTEDRPLAEIVDAVDVVDESVDRVRCNAE